MGTTSPVKVHRVWISAIVDEMTNTISELTKKKIEEENGGVEREREKEKEREFYLTPDQPGCGHKAADTAESSECSMSICLPGGSMYRSSGDLLSNITNYIGSVQVLIQ